MNPDTPAIKKAKLTLTTTGKTIQDANAEIQRCLDVIDDMNEQISRATQRKNKARLDQRKAQKAINTPQVLSVEEGQDYDSDLYTSVTSGTCESESEAAAGSTAVDSANEEL